MVSLRFLLAASALTFFTTASAASLPEHQLSRRDTWIETSSGNESFSDYEYCRWRSLSAWGWSRPGLVNITLFEYPCEVHNGSANCTVIEELATNIGQNDSINWLVDVPVNVTYFLVYSQFPGDRSAGLIVEPATTVPPSHPEAGCDQSLLGLPYSAASMSNTTSLIGTPRVYSAGFLKVAAGKGSAVGLALAVFGVAAMI